jgi:hypothetical protein
VAHHKHNQVRARYRARCGYCGVAEEDTGGDLTVDHFIPVIAGGDEGDDNLIYACFRCNLYKCDYCPSATDRAEGHVILHPFRDDIPKHLRLDEAIGELQPLTETGRFHVAVLRLNRPGLVALRLRRHFFELLLEHKDLVEAENYELWAIIKAQEKLISHLKSLRDG